MLNKCIQTFSSYKSIELTLSVLIRTESQALTTRSGSFYSVNISPSRAVITKEKVLKITLVNVKLVVTRQFWRSC